MRAKGSAGVVLRWWGAQFWRMSGRVERNRREIYGGGVGLRMVTFHDTPPDRLEHVKRLVEWARERFEMARPGLVDELVEGRHRPRSRDALLVTLDDGLSSNYEAARWLADAGIAATFFVVPSLVDRSIGEYVRHHEGFGVKAHPPVRDPDARGLASSQVREMVAMGHRIGAHNFAHRDIGRLHDAADLAYEIDNAIEGIGELTGVECRDFAFGFGQPENVSAEGVAHLVARRLRVYSCHRGLNVPGRTPRFLLRHAHERGHPLAFAKVCLEGGADHRLADRAEEMARRVGRLPVVSSAAP
jgi:peptidoglycan/xylan/chitin deacetylase (PgdA/CDA1 family)